MPLEDVANVSIISDLPARNLAEQSKEYNRGE